MGEEKLTEFCECAQAIYGSYVPQRGVDRVAAFLRADGGWRSDSLRLRNFLAPEGVTGMFREAEMHE